MKINKTIRELRIKKGMTQEQMASLLGVSAPAVNKWEKAVSYPDITLLPALARLLDTDLNRLLSFKEEPTSEEIIKFLNDLAEDASCNSAEHAFHMGMEKVRAYPNCDLLVLHVAIALEGILGLYSYDECAAFLDDIEKLYERTAQSTDPEIRDRSRTLLIYKYIDREEYERAERLLEEIPEEPVMDKKQVQTKLLMKQERWDEAAYVLERKLVMRLSDIQAVLLDLMIIALKEHRNRDADEIADISEKAVQLFGLWDYGAYSVPLQLAFTRKDTEQCIKILKNMIPAALKNWEPGKTPLYKRIAARAGTKNLGNTILPKLLRLFEDPENKEFEFLQKEPEFQQLLAEWKKHSNCLQ
ncbi:helix-turn-helix domain-containing protein [Anaerostipes sp.]|uniref:helix-turn-helix domain-containing protein n=1 Tax=Anaerostipes sp. TaxID=1872530 RepID=UPI0025B84C3D|nr:helix-turn-helix transcriptional regulator [Anaerostipes sp.]MBS7008803.1 helix-turn-helix transcriptional regulator [Anaerostipes sp.]